MFTVLQPNTDGYFTIVKNENYYCVSLYFCSRTVVFVLNLCCFYVALFSFGLLRGPVHD